MAAKKKAKKQSTPKSHTPKNQQPSLIIQFGIVFVMVAAMALLAYVFKYYTP